jgi:hypothetical protein
MQQTTESSSLPSGTENQDLSTETVNTFKGKEIAGHPFIEIDLKSVLKTELASDPYSRLSAEEVDEQVEKQLRVGGYDVTVPSYDSNNGVYLLIEPQPDGGYKAFVSAFPSEAVFQKLKSDQPNLQRFSNVAEYQDYVESSFRLGGQEALVPGKYKRSSMTIPVSQQIITDTGLQPTMSAVVDAMIKTQAR